MALAAEEGPGVQAVIGRPVAELPRVFLLDEAMMPFSRLHHPLSHQASPAFQSSPFLYPLYLS
jgi:hypothetical protein